MASHFKEVCRDCGVTVSECLCPDPNKTIIKVTCKACAAAIQALQTAPAPANEDPLAISMKFHQAMFLMDMGMKVYREGWFSRSRRIGKEEDRFIDLDGNEVITWPPNTKDMLATDWKLWKQ
jgi:hypothetical protein